MSGRLLVLTIVFVMIAEILIFVPSVARFRHDFLVDKLQKGRIASLAAVAAMEGPLHPDLEAELLREAGVLSVSFKRAVRREQILRAPMNGMIEATFDLREEGPTKLIWDALTCVFYGGGRLIRVKGDANFQDARDLEVVVDEAELKAAMLQYGERIFMLSLIISAITALLVFLSVNQFLVRPIRRVIDSLVQFREDPEDGGRIIAPSGATGEIGLAERELAEQQRAVAKALQQKSRLAALGEAIAKINHDLRNILASAQLLADRLAEDQNPAIMRVGGKLVGSLDRAIRLCKQTLAYGRADEPPPEFARVELSEMAEEIAAALDLKSNGVAAVSFAATPSARRAALLEKDAELAGDTAGGEGQSVAFVNGAPDGLAAVADPDQLFRALLNLTRNSKQAIEAAGAPGVIAIEARRRDGCVEIDVVDNGPGLPDKAKQNLFKAFQGSVRKGGTGLGMAIAAELVRGQGGDLSLVESSEGGARFRLRLPDRDEAHPTKGGGRTAAHVVSASKR